VQFDLKLYNLDGLQKSKILCQFKNHCLQSKIFFLKLKAKTFAYSYTVVKFTVYIIYNISRKSYSSLPLPIGKKMALKIGRIFLTSQFRPLNINIFQIVLKFCCTILHNLYVFKKSG
jgi:hypothetical protein